MEMNQFLTSKQDPINSRDILLTCLIVKDTSNLADFKTYYSKVQTFNIHLRYDLGSQSSDTFGFIYQFYKQTFNNIQKIDEVSESIIRKYQEIRESMRQSGLQNDEIRTFTENFQQVEKMIESSLLKDHIIKDKTFCDTIIYLGKYINEVDFRIPLLIYDLESLSQLNVININSMNNLSQAECFISAVLAETVEQIESIINLINIIKGLSQKEQILEQCMICMFDHKLNNNNHLDIDNYDLAQKFSQSNNQNFTNASQQENRDILKNLRSALSKISNTFKKQDIKSYQAFHLGQVIKNLLQSQNFDSELNIIIQIISNNHNAMYSSIREKSLIRDSQLQSSYQLNNQGNQPQQNRNNIQFQSFQNGNDKIQTINNYSCNQQVTKSQPLNEQKTIYKYSNINNSNNGQSTIQPIILQQNSQQEQKNLNQEINKLLQSQKDIQDEQLKDSIILLKLEESKVDDEQYQLEFLQKASVIISKYKNNHQYANTFKEAEQIISQAQRQQENEMNQSIIHFYESMLSESKICDEESRLNPLNQYQERYQLASIIQQQQEIRHSQLFQSNIHNNQYETSVYFNHSINQSQQFNKMRRQEESYIYGLSQVNENQNYQSNNNYNQQKHMNSQVHDFSQLIYYDQSILQNQQSFQFTSQNNQQYGQSQLYGYESHISCDQSQVINAHNQNNNYYNNSNTNFYQDQSQVTDVSYTDYEQSIIQNKNEQNNNNNYNDQNQNNYNQYNNTNNNNNTNVAQSNFNNNNHYNSNNNYNQTNNNDANNNNNNSSNPNFNASAKQKENQNVPKPPPPPIKQEEKKKGGGWFWKAVGVIGTIAGVILLL